MWRRTTYAGGGSRWQGHRVRSDSSVSRGSIEARLEAIRDERDAHDWKEGIADGYEELEIVRTGPGSFGDLFYVIERAD